MTVELYAFECGWLEMPARLFIQGAKGRMKVPVPAYLIRHPKGVALFDAGPAPALPEDTKGYLGELAAYTDVALSPDETIRGRLAAAGFDIGKVALVINSHLHWDHAGGNCTCPNADILIQRAEHAFADTAESGPGYRRSEWDTGQRIRLIDGEHDVFGDGSVTCIPTYGHTPGHQSLRVRTDRGEAILCGDACYLKRTLEERLSPGVLHNESDFQASLERLAGFRAAGAQLFFGHDPDFWAGVPRGPVRVL